jgi:phosphatidylserine/phosphatidylglycerophosphate/cardiolipin synthase-like enzyme
MAPGKETLALLNGLTDLVREVPLTALASLCQSLEALSPDASIEECVGTAEVVGSPKSRELVTSFLNAWCKNSPNVSPMNLSWAIRAAGHIDDSYRKSQSCELVWTGPGAESSAFRRTDQALLELIDGACRELIVVTFAAYKIPHIAESLLRAAERNVVISIVLESKDMSAGQMAFSELKAWGRKLTSASNIYIWPVEQRPRTDTGQHGVLHVKCAVADEKAAFISSANLTEHALNLNMELGVLIRGGAIPRDLHAHLRGLIESNVLRKAER